MEAWAQSEGPRLEAHPPEERSARGEAELCRPGAWPPVGGLGQPVAGLAPPEEWWFRPSPEEWWFRPSSEEQAPPASWFPQAAESS